MNTLRKHTISLIIIGLLAILSSSCEKVVDFEIGDLETHVVLNGIPCVDSTLFVNLSYSRFFLDNRQYLPATGAQITMWANGTEMTPSSYSNGNYFFPYQVREGDSLKVDVTLEGREPLSAATRVPYKPNLDSICALIDTTQIITTMGVHFVINDPVGDNYYRFYITERDSGSRWNAWMMRRDTIDTVSVAYFGIADLDLISEDATASLPLLGNFYGELMCRDIHFDGTQKAVTLAIMQVPDTSESEGFLKEYTLHVEALSREYYNYLCDVAQASSIMTYFAEPAQLYSNIINGLGIFAGAAKLTIPLTPIYKEPEEPSLPRGKGSRSR